jgi:hypothetical protein
VARGEKRGCFKVGCLSGLGGCAVVVLVIAVLLGIGLLTGSGDERFEPVDQAHAVPPMRETAEAHVQEPGRIVLDVTRGSFSIRPGPPGEPVRLEGAYDAGKFELEETFEAYGESGWIYRVRFDQKGFGLRPFIQHGESKNRLTLIVPRDTPVVLEGFIGIGESELELGGLWVAEVDLKFGIGEHALRFAEPLPLPMKRLRLDTSIGVLEVDSLGNASPRLVEVRHSVGETRIDLHGSWRQDAEIHIWCGIGECDVRVPDDVHVKLQRASLLIGESGSSLRRDRPEPDPAAPTLELSVSAQIGELKIRR